MKKKIISLMTALVVVVGLVGVMPVVSAWAGGDEVYELWEDTIIIEKSEVNEFCIIYDDVIIECDNSAMTQDIVYATIQWSGGTDGKFTITRKSEGIFSIVLNGNSNDTFYINVVNQKYTYGDYNYIILSDGTVEIANYYGNAEELEIPDTIEGMTVTSIGDYAFSSTNLVRLVIPYGVINIGTDAFRDNYDLTIITIPNSVTSIGDEAFYECTNLTSITIPDSVTYIGSYAFGYTFDYAEWEDTPINNFKIYCYAGTAGEQYAIDNGFDYELLDDEYLVTLEEIDINSDGKISTADVGLINAHAKGTKLLSDEALEKADVNKDGKVTTADVGLINAYAKGTKKYA